ncbi:MAG: CPBP family glutamic-type intramembrane protease [Anaerolineaceae bacterium]|nr:CPBP family glutamic-type intramembrane protease [Anaerolineaceae bacterium]
MMSINSSPVHILIILIVSALLIITGLKKQPGLGILGAVIIIILFLFFRGDSLGAIGFFKPDSWFTTIFSGLILGIVIQLFSVILIEPFSEKITGTKHDHSLIDSVKGNWKVFIQWLLVVWIFVAVIEEGVFRGFMMTEIINILGVGLPGLFISVFFTSVVFGLSHGYQSRSGIISTGIVGVILGVIFILSDFNLWLAIFTHGFIDTIGIGLIAIGGDKYLQNRFWKK